MAYFKFTKAILEGTPVEVYGGGDLLRDFTYVDDVIEALVRLVPAPPAADPPYVLHNVGNHCPVRLAVFLETLESIIGKPAHKVALPAQPGDVAATFADVDSLARATGFTPSTSLRAGLERFVEWYLAYAGPTNLNEHLTSSRHGTTIATPN
jgi:UDP-glucuronate 4-epimerase